jgi:DNA-binding LytR/AlgR family response regulator
MFLDIRMPELDGFGVVRAIPSSVQMPLIIFATSYDEHALEAFEANAIAYLLKPVEVERLTAALERARRLLASEAERNETNCACSL